MGAGRRVAVWAVTLLTFVGVLVMASEPAWAHARLESSTPSDGANLKQAPGEVVLRFTEPINPASVAVAVLDANDAPATEGEPRVAGVNVTQPLRRSLPTGHYAVAFQVVSADGHRINGRLHFAIVAPAPAPSAANPAPPGSKPASSAPATHHGHHQPSAPTARRPDMPAPASGDAPTAAWSTAAGASAAALALLCWWVLGLRAAAAGGRRGHHRQMGPVPVTGGRLAGAGMLAAGAALAAGLAFGGGASRIPLPGLPDPGQATAWLLPITRIAMMLGAVATVGLVVAAALLSPAGALIPSHRRGTAPTRRLLGDRGLGWLTAASWAAAGWCAAAILALWLSYADLTGRPPTQGLSPTQLAAFAVQTPIGRALTAVTVLTSAIVVCSRAVRSVAGSVALLALAAIAVVPPVFTGHTATGRYPHLATSALVLHVVPATLWAGGLLALALSARVPAGQLATAVSRFSPLAGACFAAVGLSGLLSAWVHLPDYASPTGSAYGQLILAKAAVLAGIGAAGWWHRRRSMPALRSGSRRRFAGVAAVEVVLFGTVVGLAIALSRTAPPGASAPHAGHAMAGDHPLLGYPMPPPPSATGLLSWWLPQPIFMAAAACAAVLYQAVVRRLRRHDHGWPPWRTTAWLGGCAVVLAATSTGLARYAPTLLSVHVVQYLLMTVVAPLLLTLGAPIALGRAGRTLVAGTPGWPGPRDWLPAIAHSAAGRLLQHPALVMIAAASGIPVLYLGGLYETAQRSPATHLAVSLCSTALGLLLLHVLLSRPVSRRRLLALACAGVYALAGAALMWWDTSLGGTWFAELARPWAAPDDRYHAGIAVLILGALPLLITGLTLVYRPATAQTSPPQPTTATLPGPRPAMTGLSTGHGGAGATSATVTRSAHAGSGVGA